MSSRAREYSSAEASRNEKETHANDGVKEIEVLIRYVLDNRNTGASSSGAFIICATIVLGKALVQMDHSGMCKSVRYDEDIPVISDSGAQLVYRN